MELCYRIIRWKFHCELCERILCRAVVTRSFPEFAPLSASGFCQAIGIALIVPYALLTASTNYVRPTTGQ